MSNTASRLNTVLITGSNRGIGLQLVKAIIPTLKPKLVFATYRDPAKSEELLELASQNKTIKTIQLDVRENEKLADVAGIIDKEVGDLGLNLLINNAGITSKIAKISGVRHNELIDNMIVNTVAPIMMTKTMLPLLKRASAAKSGSPAGISRAAVVNMTSVLGSISLNEQGGMYSYRCSKAGLNAATKSLHYDFQQYNIIAIALHPGWVRTEMGGKKAHMSVEESADGIISLLDSLNAQHSGKFLQYDGIELPW